MNPEGKKQGFSTLGLFLAFLGGAAAGATVALAADPENRKKLKDAVDSSMKIAKRVPTAIHDARTAMKDALVPVHH